MIIKKKKKLSLYSFLVSLLFSNDPSGPATIHMLIAKQISTQTKQVCKKTGQQTAAESGQHMK